jgi:hypothetical protein
VFVVFLAWKSSLSTNIVCLGDFRLNKKRNKFDQNLKLLSKADILVDMSDKDFLQPREQCCVVGQDR